MGEDQETAVTAHQKLSAAVHEFYQSIDPEAFIGDWVLVVHKDTAELHAEGTSAIRWVAAEEQAFHRTVGLLTVAADVAKGK